MGRRSKRELLSDGDSSDPTSSDQEDNSLVNDANDADVQAERELFTDPWGRGVKRKRPTKEEQWEGEFGEPPRSEMRLRGKGARAEKSKDWTKAQSFVSASKPGPKPDEPPEASSAEPVNETLPNDMQADANQRAGTGNARGGLGAGRSLRPSDFVQAGASPTASTGTGTPQQSSSSQIRGIGFRPAPSLVQTLREEISSEQPQSSGSESAPSSRDGSPFERRNFRGERPQASNQSNPKAPKPLSRDEAAHFAKLQRTGGAALKMMEKMGWKTGEGLGAGGTGIVTPVSSKARPKAMGLAYEGFNERTEQAKLEARRRGEEPESDEESRTNQQGGRPTKPNQRDPPKARAAWTKVPKKYPKIRVEHRTYEEIVEREIDAAPSISGLGQIIDATGAELRELPSVPASLSFVPSAETSLLPELRHNLSLILSTASADLSSLAREARGVKERQAMLDREEARTKRSLTVSETQIKDLEQVMVAVGKIEAVCESGEQNDFTKLVKALDAPVFELSTQFSQQYNDYRLDELVVAALTPVARNAWRHWEPLEAPMLFRDTFQRWQKALVLPSGPSDTHRAMSPYESLLWNHWLPRVRSAINNAWDPYDSDVVITLYTVWQPVLPQFLRDNILDQLILPKLNKALLDWSPKRPTRSFNSLIIPWLEHTGPRTDDLIQASLRKLRQWLSVWKPQEGVPIGLGFWKQVIQPQDWDELILKQVLPKLGTWLRDRFRVNPREQDLKPLQAILEWNNLLTPSFLNQLLESEFFPKWLEALYIWLTHEPNYDQVAEWYSYWKSFFPPDVAELPGVARGFSVSRDLMHQAMALGNDARYRLERPQFGRPSTPTKRVPVKPIAPPAYGDNDVSFRSVVEDACAANNLILSATGKSHQQTGQPLFKVSKTASGKGGITIYFGSDMIWIQRDSEWHPISIEDMMTRIN